MKEKTKELLKKYLIGFILGLGSVGIVAVYAETYFHSNDVTYDNKASGLSSTDVQGAIDELYGVCTAKPPAGETIIENAGLEKDPYECRYFFTGANPNNYITFNGEEAGWRIISVECDGSIKIIKNESIGTMKWDSSETSLGSGMYYGNTNWARPADLNTYLNSDYYNNLSVTAQSQIISHNWSIGQVIYDNNDLVAQVENENNEFWNGNIALPTISEFLRTNSNKSQCGTMMSFNNNWVHGSTTGNLCKNTTWMVSSAGSEIFWSLTKIGIANILPISNAEISDYYNPYSTVNVKPSLYLSSDIKITGGDGSQNNPYTLG